MKFIFLIIFPMVMPGLTVWHNNLDEAKQLALQQHKHILLNFSGSDWCGPCIRMHKEIFDDAGFSIMADTELVMVNADFPRLKKNQLSAVQQKLNDQMADEYNAQGNFPCTILLDAKGKTLKEWDGLPDESAIEFTVEVKNIIDGDK